jgi:hypothetical protein
MSLKKIFLVLAVVLFTSKGFTANPVSDGSQNLKQDHQKILKENPQNYL